MAISYAEWRLLQNGVRDSYYFFRKLCPPEARLGRPELSEDEFYARRSIYSANQRARRRGDPERISIKQWMDLCDMYDNRCLRCGERTRLTLDHVIPFSLGGRNVIENIQPLCQNCNNWKWTLPMDFRNGESVLRKGR